jgi:WD40 repeat protein
VRLWETTSGRPLASYHNQGGAVQALAFTPNGRRVVSGDAAGTVRVWEGTGRRGVWTWLRAVWARAQYSAGAPCSTWQELGCLRGHTRGLEAVAVSRDGEWIVSAEESQPGRSRVMRLWDLRSGVCCEVIDGDGDVQGVADWDRRALVRGGETVIQFGPTGEELAWFPARFREVVTLSDGRSWAAVEGDHLYLLVLEEGDPSRGTR